MKRGDLGVVDHAGLKGGDIFVAENGTWNRAIIGPPGSLPLHRGRTAYVKSPLDSQGLRDAIPLYGLREQLSEMFGYYSSSDDPRHSIHDMLACRAEAAQRIHADVAQVLARWTLVAGRWSCERARVAEGHPGVRRTYQLGCASQRSAT